MRITKEDIHAFEGNTELVNNPDSAFNAHQLAETVTFQVAIFLLNHAMTRQDACRVLGGSMQTALEIGCAIGHKQGYEQGQKDLVEAAVRQE